MAKLSEKDEYFMGIALGEAKKALSHDDVPIGAIIVENSAIIANAHNTIEKNHNPLHHAEYLAIEQATSKLKSKYLQDCTLYTTLEPCSMCAGAIILTRIPRIVIAAKDSKSGASGSVFNLTNNNKLNHRCEVLFGVMEGESSTLLKDFFKKLRENKKKLNGIKAKY